MTGTTPPTNLGVAQHMQVLRHGSVGSAVWAWQYFLIGKGLLAEEASGYFSDGTKEATQAFQRGNGLDDDGEVGTFTYGAALSHGLPVVTDDTAAEQSMRWPPPPDFKPMGGQERAKTFGSFKYTAAPTASNPEAIRMEPGWEANHITMVEVPQLVGKQGAPKNGRVQFHKLAAVQLQALFNAWEEAGLLDCILSWGGSYAPRFVRGSKTYLSNHSSGTAFDINAGWNPLGVQPPLKGKPGSVRELVPLANQYGFFWGGHWGYTPGGRADGMHFEVARLIYTRS